ncbi:MAG: hypothetical protein WAO00_16490, partial [Chthoniobacterales bacterium]
MAPGRGNLISGNTGGIGVLVQREIRSGQPDINPSYNVVQGNLIGTDATGLIALPNEFGVFFSASTGFGDTSAPGNKIGGMLRPARNVISGNNGDGIKGEGNFPALRIQGNLIGTGTDGMTPLGNKRNGIILVGGLFGSIIGPETGPNLDGANTIAFNGGDSFFFAGAGVSLVSGSSTSLASRVSSNSIHDNIKLGIDLNGDGVTPNDPNFNFGRQNFPVLSGAFAFNGQLTICGTLNSLASTNFTLEFFANQNADSSGYGEGQIFLGQAKVVTDSAGNAGFNVTFPLPANVTAVTATAIGPFGSIYRVSEFSGALSIASTQPTVPPTSPTAVVLPTRASKLLNLSTRLRVETGEDVLIGGFIVSGNDPKKIIVRGIGPSLNAFHVPDFLADPVLELYDASGQLL